MNDSKAERTEILKELAPLLNKQDDEFMKNLLAFLKSGDIRNLVDLKIYIHGGYLEIDIWVFNKGRLEKVDLSQKDGEQVLFNSKKRWKK